MTIHFHGRGATEGVQAAGPLGGTLRTMPGMVGATASGAGLMILGPSNVGGGIRVPIVVDGWLLWQPVAASTRIANPTARLAQCSARARLRSCSRSIAIVAI